MTDIRHSMRKSMLAYIQQKKEKHFTLEEYSVVLECADKPKGSCQAIVHVTLHGGKTTGEEEELAIVEFPEKMHRGYRHTFVVRDQKMETVDGVTVRGDTMVGNTGWNIDKIMVTRMKTGSETVIPVFTTIRSGRSYRFNADDTSLPQFFLMKGGTDRQSNLKEKMDCYELTEERLPGGPPLLKRFPEEEHFSFSYKLNIGNKLLSGEGDAFYTQLKIGKEFDSIAAIQEVYDRVVFPTPSNLNRWKDDVLFGMQRLMGVNCEVIRLCTELPAKLGVDPKMLEALLENKSVSEALEQKRLFSVDYEILEGLPTRKGYIMSAPIALFYQRDDGKLVPVAIQLSQNSDNSPVFLPSDQEYTWILAKMWFNVADANYHESICHLGFTHLKMEGVVACTHRQIHTSHPVYKLLMNHFIYLIAIDWIGLPLLMDKDGFIDKVLTLGSTGMKALIVKKNKTWRMDVEGTLPNELEARGVKDQTLLPNYYYRDDALELYEVIYSYVEKYLDLYYKSDNDVEGDIELQNWRAELTAPVADQGLGMQGVFGENGRFTKKEQVCLTLTSIIYTCSAQHAAVNFRQYEEYGYPPNMPFSLRGNLPTTKVPVDEKGLLQALPNVQTTLNSMIISNTLSMRGMKKLGDFEVNYITDRKALQVVDSFCAELEVLARLNKKKNKARLEPYTCLSPSLVPNSISI